MSDDTNTPPQDGRRARGKLRLAIIIVLVLWIYGYNYLIKELGFVGSFFRILDTISDDFVMGTLFAVGIGVGIVIVYSATKLYTQIIANIYSFRIIEGLVFDHLRRGEFRTFLKKILHFEELPQPESVCPQRVSSLLMSVSFMYVMSMVYVVLFSEALFFVSWSAGVDLKLDNESELLYLPTLALAIPFSARAMAYARYPYAQDYADFMPGAVFVLLLVSALGFIFQSADQQSFLERVLDNPDYLQSFLRNGVFLAFIPVFFEGIFWLVELGREDRAKTDQTEANQDETEA